MYLLVDQGSLPRLFGAIHCVSWARIAHLGVCNCRRVVITPIPSRSRIALRIRRRRRLRRKNMFPRSSSVRRRTISDARI